MSLKPKKKIKPVGSVPRPVLPVRPAGQELTTDAGIISSDSLPTRPLFDENQPLPANAQTMMPKPLVPVLAPKPTLEPPPVFQNSPLIAPSRPAIKPVSKMQSLKDEIDERSNRDYSGVADWEHPYRTKGGFIDKLKSMGKTAGMNFLQAFAQNPNLPVKERLLNAVGGGLGGAAVGGFDSNADEKMQNRQVLSNLYNDYANESAIEADKQKQEAERQKAEQAAIKARFELIGLGLDNDGKVIGNQGKLIGNEGNSLDNLQKFAKPFYDSLLADGQITPEESAEIKQKYNLDIKPYDARQFNVEYKNGVAFASPKLGNPDYKPVRGLPIVQGEVEKEFDVDGKKFTTSTNKILPLAVSTANANANRGQSASQFNVTQANKEEEQKYQRSQDALKLKTEWQNNVTKATADFSKANNELAQLYVAKDNAFGDELTKINADIKTAEGNKAAALVLMNAKDPTMQTQTQRKGKNLATKKTLKPVRSGGKTTKTTKTKGKDPLGLFN